MGLRLKSSLTREASMWLPHFKTDIKTSRQERANSLSSQRSVQVGGLGG